MLHEVRNLLKYISVQVAELRANQKLLAEKQAELAAVMRTRLQRTSQLSTGNATLKAENRALKKEIKELRKLLEIEVEKLSYER